MIRVLLAIVLISASALGQDLTGLSFCIDPGHGGHNPANDRRIEPDPGNVFWESEGNFQKALRLDTLLRQQGAVVILTRYTNDYPTDAEPSLTARWQLANANNVNWFHSIHSNAFNGAVNYTLVLLKENITTRQPAFPEALTMSNIIAPSIRGKLRTSSSAVALDYTFYGGTNGGFNLGVLSGLTMPGELSEGSFHDYYPETRRLLNNDYLKMEAYAIRNAFMQYFGAAPDTLGIIAGLQTEIGTGRPLNQTLVRLLPEDRVFAGDSFNNGFYMFDGLAPGQKTIRFETPGFVTDSVQVTVNSGETVFRDRQLESFLPPFVVTSIPVQGDTLFSADRSITIRFSKVMDTASVRSAFSIDPAVNGTFTWSVSNTTLVFDPDSSLPFYSPVTITIDTTAHSLGGQTIDGDGNGTAGDPFTLMFRTKDIDILPPAFVSRYPSVDDTLSTPTGVLTITFDEPLNPATVSLLNVVVQKVGASILPRTLEYHERGGRSGVNIYLTAPFEPGSSYRIRASGLADQAGNVIPGSDPSTIWQCFVRPGIFASSIVEQFDSALVNWFSPGASGSTTGIDSAFFEFDPVRHVPTIDPNPGGARLRYYWNTQASDWLIREYLAGGPPREVIFDKENSVLQVYVNGDGSGNEFRFAVDDSVEVFPGGTAQNHEVSRWFPIDWVGWRLVRWDLAHDPVGSWIGNGILEGRLRFDSFQLRHVPGAFPSGEITFDQLQVVTGQPVSVNDEPSGVPERFTLSQNYPNPFNPVTTIEYTVGVVSSQLPVVSVVRLAVYDILGREVATLVNQPQHPGTYAVQFDASRLASGIYLYRLEAGSFVDVKKMILLR